MLQPTLCSRCQKNPAVVFVSKSDGKQFINEGYCLSCAINSGITPVNQLAEQFSIDPEELKEMVDMLKCETEIPEIARVIEKYGVGFDVIYFDGKESAKLEMAENLLKAGVDELIISQCSGFTIDQIRDIKRKL